MEFLKSRVYCTLSIYSNFTFLDFSFEIEVTLSVKTKVERKKSWPLKAKLLIEEQVGKRILMKNPSRGWQELPNNITISGIKFADNEFESDKIRIKFKSIAGKNFGKKDDAAPVDPIRIKFTTFWELDNNPSNTGVGAVLQNVDKPIEKEAVINVESACKDWENCECDVKLTSLEMTSPPNQHYIVGEVSKLNFDLVLDNSGDESALNTTVQLFSSIMNPTKNANNKPKGDSVAYVENITIIETKEGNTEEKFIWEWKIPAIGKKTQTTASFKFQLDKVNFTGQESPLEKFNIKVIPWCNRNSKTLLKEADQALSFKYVSEVKWEKRDTDETKQTVPFDDGSRKVPFSQTFMITNKGPSQTVEDTQLKIYVPHTKLVKSINVQIDGKNCTKDTQGMVARVFIQKRSYTWSHLTATTTMS